MKFLKKLFKWIFLLSLGFILGLLVGNWENLSTTFMDIDESAETTGEEAQTENENQLNISPWDILRPKPNDVNKDYVEARIIELVNELRTEQGLNTVRRNQILTDAANIRAIETETLFSHTRPDGTDPFSVLNESNTIYNYLLAGENLAMATYHRSDEHMTELIFQGWVDSEDHYATMINPDFIDIGVGVHYDGEILYATQFFGTPY